MVVAMGEDAVAWVWEARTGKLVRKLQVADFPIWRDWTEYKEGYVRHKGENWLSLSADKRTVAIAGTDRTIVWDMTNGKRIRHTQGVR